MVQTVDCQIGERVERFRQAASLSTQEVASACSLPLKDYEAGEAGDRPFGAAELLLISKNVGFSLYDVFKNLKL